MKKFILIILLILVACQPVTQKPLVINKTVGETEQMTVAAVLLPLSGQHEKIGNALKNAAMMAQMEQGNDKLALRFYDTEGSATGAEKAIYQAIAENAKVVIGPLFSYEVDAIKGIARRKKIDMLVLSSDPTVIEKGVYTASLLMPQQVDRIITYACEKGKRNFAVLAQDNTVGNMMVETAKASAERCGARVTKVGFYNVRQGNYDKAVKAIIGERTTWIDEERKRAKIKKPKKEEVIEIDAFGEEKEIEEPEEEENLPPPLEFDAVLIAEEGNRLRSIGSLLSFYEIEAKMLGTSLWANDPNIRRERGLIGGWYAAPPERAYNAFAKQYKELFEETPPRMTGQIYDAVKIVAQLVDEGNLTEQGITDPHGFLGTDGPVRLVQNGYSERALEVREVGRRANKTLSGIQMFNDDDPYYLNKYSGIELPPEPGKPEPKEAEMICDENGENCYAIEQHATEGEEVEVAPGVTTRALPYQVETLPPPSDPAVQGTRPIRAEPRINRPTQEWHQPASTPPPSDPAISRDPAVRRPASQPKVSRDEEFIIIDALAE